MDIKPVGMQSSGNGSSDQEALDGKAADWMEQVSDEQYQAMKEPSR